MSNQLVFSFLPLCMALLLEHVPNVLERDLAAGMHKTVMPDLGKAWEFNTAINNAQGPRSPLIDKTSQEYNPEVPDSNWRMTMEKKWLSTNAHEWPDALLDREDVLVLAMHSQDAGGCPPRAEHWGYRVGDLYSVRDRRAAGSHSRIHPGTCPDIQA